MEHPYGRQHHSRHHEHHRRDEDEGEYPPPAQPPPPPPTSSSYYYGGGGGGGLYDEQPPRQPQVSSVYHTSHDGPLPYAPPPPPPTSSSFYYGGGGGGGGRLYDEQPPRHPQVTSVYHASHDGPLPYAPPPAESAVHHVAHESGYRHPHIPSFIRHHEQQPHVGSDDISDGRPSLRVYCKARTDYSLTIRDHKVILAPSDPSDPFQHWIKDEKYSTKVKDEQGFPSFALINKATGLAIKHSTGATQPVQLVPYRPDVFDESILWTLSKDLGDGFRTIRMVNNIRLNVDAFNGDENHGGVHDGTFIVLWEWKKGDNQRWAIIPY